MATDKCSSNHRDSFQIEEWEWIQHHYRPSAFNRFNQTTAKHEQSPEVKSEDTQVGEGSSSSSSSSGESQSAGRANIDRGDGCTDH